MNVLCFLQRCETSQAHGGFGVCFVERTMQYRIEAHCKPTCMRPTLPGGNMPWGWLLEWGERRRCSDTKVGPAMPAGLQPCFTYLNLFLQRRLLNVPMLHTQHRG